MKNNFIAKETDIVIVWRALMNFEAMTSGGSREEALCLYALRVLEQFKDSIPMDLKYRISSGDLENICKTADIVNRFVYGD